MTDLTLRLLVAVTLGLALALLLRRPARRAFGAGPAFALWLLPPALAAASLLPPGVVPAAMVALPGIIVTPHAAIAAAPPVAVQWAAGLWALWLLGGAIGLFRIALHYLRLVRGLRRVPAAWNPMLARIAPRVDPRRLRVHAAGPAVLWAMPRALILLPVDFAARFGNGVTRALVLRHEIVHVRRGDAIWSLAMELASAVLWFHPLVWLARSRFRVDQELACDAAALRGSARHAADYARTLLDSVAARPASALIPWLTVSQLKERIAMLMHVPPGAFRRRVGFITISALLTGGIVVAAGAATTIAAPRYAHPASIASIRISHPATGGSPASRPPSVDVSFRNRNPPAYPVEAIKEGEQGSVLLKVKVDSVGRVVGVSVDPAKTTAPVVLQTAAIQAAKGWRFNPGSKDGHAAGGVVTVPVTFSLNGFRSTPPSECPPGFHYKQGEGRSFSCLAPKSGPASA